MGIFDGVSDVVVVVETNYFSKLYWTVQFNVIWNQMLFTFQLIYMAFPETSADATADCYFIWHQIKQTDVDGLASLKRTNKVYNSPKPSSMAFLFQSCIAILFRFSCMFRYRNSFMTWKMNESSFTWYQ